MLWKQVTLPSIASISLFYEVGNERNLIRAGLVENDG